MEQGGPFFYYLHEKPVLEFCNPSSEPRSPPQFTSEWKVFIEETADDLVLIGDTEVYFAKLTLASTTELEHLMQRASMDGNPQPDSSIGITPTPYCDVLCLRVPKKHRQILVAKRCPSLMTGVAKDKFYVAVMHEPTLVHFYAVTRDERWAKECQPFAFAMCRPNNFRFGSKAYPLRSFYWSAFSDGMSFGPSQPLVDETAEPSASSRGGDASFASATLASPPGSPTRIIPSIDSGKYLVLLSEVSIDLVCVSDRAFADARVVLIKRVTTKIHFWVHHPPSRMLVAVNKAKQTNIKPFSMDRSNVLRNLPQFKVEENPELPQVSYFSSLMDPPLVNYHIQIVQLYGKTFICHLTPRQQLTMYQWVISLREQADGANMGSFEKKFVLSMRSEPQQPVKLQTLDNLLVAHWPDNKHTAAYDIQMPTVVLEGIEHVDPTENTSPRSGFFSRFSFSSADAVHHAPAIRPNTVIAPLHTFGTEDGEESPYTCLFYNGYQPYVLDLRKKRVMLLSVDSRAIAQARSNPLHCVKLLLHRFGCGGLTIYKRTRAAIEEQIPLTVLGQLFDSVCEHYALTISKGTSIVEFSESVQRLRTLFTTQTPYGSPVPPLFVQGMATGDSIEGLSKVFPTCFVFENPIARSGSAPLSFEEAVSVFADWGERNSYVVPSSVGRVDCVDQMMMFQHVFAPIVDIIVEKHRNAKEKRASDNSKIEQVAEEGENYELRAQLHFSRYVLHALLEYTRAIIQHGIPLGEHIQKLVIDMMLSSPTPDYFRLHQLLMYRAINDHTQTALQLLLLEREYPPAFQMGLDMLSRMGATNHIISAFLDRSMPLRAAKYIRNCNLKDAPILQVLQCAAKAHDEARAAKKRAAGQKSATSVGEKKCCSPDGFELTEEGGTFCTVFALMKRHILDNHLTAANLQAPDSASHGGEETGDDTGAVLKPFQERYDGIASGRIS